MRPEKTHELRITLAAADPGEAALTKRRLLDWLPGNGVEEFVEGVIDNVEVDHDYDNPDRDFYGELGGATSAVSIFSYSIETLQDIRSRLHKEFGDRLVFEILTIDTEVWTEGWKESFKPFASGRLLVFPPWHKGDCPAGLAPVEIEPGMAFGTGQHATTRLCLAAMEDLATGPLATRSSPSMLDVGTGSGILAIAGAKLGFSAIVGTDIEQDAIAAAGLNCRRNDVEVVLWQGSVPVANSLRANQPEVFDLVVANILSVVLEKIMKELVSATALRGYLILSGLRTEEEEHIRALAGREGLLTNSNAAMDGWSCLVLSRLSVAGMKSRGDSQL